MIKFIKNNMVQIITTASFLFVAVGHLFSYDDPARTLLVLGWIGTGLSALLWVRKILND